MAFSYTDFEDIVPGNTVDVLAIHANELRSAIIERADLIELELSGTIPDAVIAHETPILFSWLTGMRTAIEAIITEGKYGVLKVSGSENVWTTSFADIISEVHSRFADCGSGDDWIEVDQYDEPMAAHIRELYYMCEALSFLDGSYNTGLNLWSVTGGTAQYDVDYDEDWQSGYSPYHLQDGAEAYLWDPGGPEEATYRERQNISMDIALECAEIYIASARYDSSNDPLTIWDSLNWSGTTGGFVKQYSSSMGWTAFYSLSGVTEFDFSFGPVDVTQRSTGTVLDTTSSLFFIDPDFIVRPTLTRNNGLFLLDPEA